MNPFRAPVNKCVRCHSLCSRTLPLPCPRSVCFKGLKRPSHWGLLTWQVGYLIWDCSWMCLLIHFHCLSQCNFSVLDVIQSSFHPGDSRVNDGALCGLEGITQAGFTRGSGDNVVYCLPSYWSRNLFRAAFDCCSSKNKSALRTGCQDFLWMRWARVSCLRDLNSKLTFFSFLFYRFPAVIWHLLEFSRRSNLSSYT